MIKFYTLPAPTEMGVYAGETGGRAWNDASYNTGLPDDWKTNNTEERIKAILQAKASQFAFSASERELKAYYIDAVRDESQEIIVVLKGIHQYQKPRVGVETAHITVAWYTNLCHFNIKQITGSIAIGVAALGVNGVTIGAIALSSEATGWKVVTKS